MICSIHWGILYAAYINFDHPVRDRVRRRTCIFSVLRVGTTLYQFGISSDKVFKDRLASCGEFQFLRNLKEVYFKECFLLLLRIPKYRNPFFLEALILRHYVLKTLRIFIYLYSVFCVECIRMYWFIITEWNPRVVSSSTRSNSIWK